MRKSSLLFAIVAGCTLGACHDDFSATPEFSDDTMVWDVRLNHQAILMSTQAPYDTIRLVLHARNANGEFVPLHTPVQFRSYNKSVMVDSGGLIRALNTTTDAWVIAQTIEENILYTDSVRIRVVNQTPTAQLRELRLLADSLTLAAVVRTPLGTQVPEDKKIVVEALDADNHVVPGVYTRFWVSDSIAARIDPFNGNFRGLIPNRRVVVYVAATLFGNSVLDSIEMNITDPLLVKVGVVTTYPKGSSIPTYQFSPSDIAVGAGGSVIFSLTTDSSYYDVSFQDSSKVESGKILGAAPAINEFLFGTAAGNIKVVPGVQLLLGPARSFPHAGQYRYWSAALNAEGTISVR